MVTFKLYLQIFLDGTILLTYPSHFYNKTNMYIRIDSNHLRTTSVADHAFQNC